MPSVLDPLAHNVKYIFLFTLAYWSASSLISQQVLSGYLFETQSVGILRGLQGLTQLVVALPAGYAADHLRRDRVLKFAGGLGIATSLVTAFAFQIGCLPLMYVAFAMWGAFTAFQSPAMEALFADSLPVGQRSMPFTVKLVARSAALVVGPACAILLLLYNGDKWELPVVRPVLLCGSFAAMLSMGILFLFNDDEAYERQQHQLAVERQLRSIERNFDAEVSDYTVADVLVVSGRDRGETSYSEAQSRGPSEISKLIAAPSRTNVNKNAYNTNTMADESAVNSDAGGAARAKSTVPVFCGLDPTHVPPVLFVADFLVSNGTGMAMSVFPLFFANELGLAPIGIQWLFVAQPLCVGLGSILSQLLSRHLGRMPVIAATRAIGTVSVLLMAQPTGIHFHAQCFLFLLSTAMTNCSEPLRRSLLMDLVPRTQRARWSSLEGLSTGSWAGSAVLGGLLVETHGTRFCLVATSLLYAVGVALELLLIPLTRFAVETYATPSPASTAIQR